MTMYEEFRPGQTVVWGKRADELPFIKERNGPGPFVVKRIQDIDPDACSCGGSMQDADHDFQGECPYAHQGYGPRRESVGHSQWVWVIPQDFPETDPGKAIQFSGAFFTAA